MSPAPRGHGAAAVDAECPPGQHVDPARVAGQLGAVSGKARLHGVPRFFGHQGGAGDSGPFVRRELFREPDIFERQSGPVMFLLQAGFVGAGLAFPKRGLPFVGRVGKQVAQGGEGPGGSAVGGRDAFGGQGTGQAVKADAGRIIGEQAAHDCGFVFDN